jgi:hypothetical protein
LEKRVWGHEFRNRSLGTGVWGQEFGDRSLRTGVWGQEFGERSWAIVTKQALPMYFVPVIM